MFKKNNYLQWISIKKSIERPNQYLDYLIQPGFQGVNSFFVLSCEDEARRTNKSQTILPSNCRYNRLQCYNQWEKVFDHPVINKLRTYDSIRKVPTEEMITQSFAGL